MNTLLDKIRAGETLCENDCELLIDQIASGNVSDIKLASFLAMLHLRGEQLEELRGFSRALLVRSVKPEIDGTNAIDLCGTGGDHKNTFNISTTSSFVLAALGYKVIKHGNYGVSSLCGSSTVLEALGFTFQTSTTELNSALKHTNCCFLHAPLFHPTLKKVAEVRKQLGFRTIFNALGPLVNPVQPAFQLTGTYSLELARSYASLFRSKRKNFGVTFGMDGYDELTLACPTRYFGMYSDEIISSRKYQLRPIDPHYLQAATSPSANANLIRSILKGEGTFVQHAVIAANVVEAIRVMDDTQPNRLDLFREVMLFIESGQTAKTFKLN